VSSNRQPNWPDDTQPIRPFDPDATQPARRIPLDATQPARPTKDDRQRTDRRYTPIPNSQSPIPNPQSPIPNPRRRGCLVALLLLAALVCVGGVFAYGLLVAPGPLNVLVLGIDRRPGEGDAVRTDTLLLVHADPGSGRLAMLSIPRDLWVSIPGHGEGRINTAHVYGELEAPGKGPQRVAETVSHNLGVPVDYTLRLDFDAFRQVIDAAGGIEIEVPEAIVDDAYPTEDYGVMRIEIPAGMQHMDGERALQYARSRHGSSDLHRAARQQQIFVALAKKLTSPGGWPLLPGVYQALQSAVETDMGLRDLSRLALAWQRAGEGGVEQIVIDRDMTTPFQTADGAAVLLPRWELIHPLVSSRFKLR